MVAMLMMKMTVLLVITSLCPTSFENLIIWCRFWLRWWLSNPVFNWIDWQILFLMRLIVLYIDRAHRDDSKTPLLVFIRPILKEKSTIIRIEVSVNMLMKLIILSMDSACSHISKTPIWSPYDHYKSKYWLWGCYSWYCFGGMVDIVLLLWKYCWGGMWYHNIYSDSSCCSCSSSCWAVAVSWLRWWWYRRSIGRLHRWVFGIVVYCLSMMAK